MYTMDTTITLSPRKRGIKGMALATTYFFVASTACRMFACSANSPFDIPDDSTTRRHRLERRPLTRKQQSTLQQQSTQQPNNNEEEVVLSRNSPLGRREQRRSDSSSKIQSSNERRRRRSGGDHDDGGALSTGSNNAGLEATPTRAGMELERNARRTEVVSFNRDLSQSSQCSK